MLSQRITYLQRRIFNRKVLVCTCLVLLHSILFKSNNSKPASLNCHEPIDVVYTWVNGSDLNLMKSILKWSSDNNYHPKRFDDKNELKYSLRSLDRYAPWVRHIYIVANEIPFWLDLSNKRTTVVSHGQLVSNLKFLPLFNSDAIETFLHRIPNLSKRFLYMNDDFFLAAPLYPEDLYTESEGVKIYQTWNLPDCAEDCPWSYIGDGACNFHCNISECQFDGGDCSIDSLPSQRVAPFQLPNFSRGYKNAAQLHELMKEQNFSTLKELKKVLETFEKQQNTVAPVRSNSISKSKNIEVMDTWTLSVIHTNMLLNRHYGFKPRKFIAHVGYLLDRFIIKEMQAKFSDHVLKSLSNRFRSVDDLQFQFGYYYFLMSETITLSVEQIFDEFDTDGSGKWSDGEVRILLARMFPILDRKVMQSFEEVIRNCSRNLMTGKTKDVELTRHFVSNCYSLSEAMKTKFATRSKYKHKINSVRNDHSRFMELRSNISEVLDELDRIRRTPRKFNCINDDLDPTMVEENVIVRNLLEDFYKSFLPNRSEFEMPEGVHNPFSTWKEYEEWRRQQRLLWLIGYCLAILSTVVFLRSCCLTKVFPRIFRM